MKRVTIPAITLSLGEGTEDKLNQMVDISDETVDRFDNWFADKLEEVDMFDNDPGITVKACLEELANPHLEEDFKIMLLVIGFGGFVRGAMSHKANVVMEKLTSILKAAEEGV